jgi:tripartite-type tricarboxylate transporter receptor subunit TctC
VRKDAPARTIEDALRRNGPALVLGGTAAGGGSSDVPKILQDTIGINMRLVAGYRDSAAIYLAMENGEVNGRTTELSSVKSTRPGWLRPDSNFRILLQYARATRLAMLSEVPTAREIAPTEMARALIEFTEAPFSMAYPYAAPPQLPPDRAAALQAAFMTVHRDPEFLQEAKATGIDVSPVTAADLRRAIDVMAQAPSETFDYVRRLLAAGAAK